MQLETTENRRARRRSVFWFVVMLLVSPTIATTAHLYVKPPRVRGSYRWPWHAERQSPVAVRTAAALNQSEEPKQAEALAGNEIWRWLYRLWLAISFLWAVFSLQSGLRDALRLDATLALANIFVLPLVAIAPPLILLAVAYLIVWVACAFSDAVTMPPALNLKAIGVVGLISLLSAAAGVWMLQ